MRQRNKDLSQKKKLVGDIEKRIADRYMEIPELTPRILHEFVEKIIVHVAIDPHRKVKRAQQIDIYYKGIGSLEMSKIYATRQE